MSRNRIIVLTCIFLAACLCQSTHGQDGIGDVLSGSLIKPEVGVFVWYKLTDNSTESTYYLRQAVVEKEKVKRKTGYWVETQLLPEQGIPILYRMLLTGPANDPNHVHRILVQGNTGVMDEVDVSVMVDEKPETLAQEDLGEASVETVQGTLTCRHVRLLGEEPMELWLNDTVRPTGIVKAESARGTLLLQRFGTGGPDAAAQAAPQKEPVASSGDNVTTIEQDEPETSRGGVKRNFNKNLRRKR